MEESSKTYLFQYLSFILLGLICWSQYNFIVETWFSVVERKSLWDIDTQTWIIKERQSHGVVVRMLSPGSCLIDFIPKATVLDGRTSKRSLSEVSVSWIICFYEWDFVMNGSLAPFFSKDFSWPVFIYNGIIQAETLARYQPLDTRLPSL